MGSQGARATHLPARRPGLIAGAGKVRAELYEVIDREAFRMLDRHERYDRLLEPNVDAWVYVYNRGVGTGYCSNN